MAYPSMRYSKARKKSRKELNMNSGWGMRLVVRFTGLLIAVMAVGMLPLPVNYKWALLLSGGLLVMVS